MTGIGNGDLLWERDGRYWPNREASRFIKAGGLDWHVQQMGRGPVALLIHGTAATTHSWAELMPMLAERLTVVAPDLPGHGFTSPLPRAKMSLGGIGAALSALVETLGLRPEIAIGQSAGAAILARMILDRRIAPRLFISLNGALSPFPGVAGHIFPAMAKLFFLNPVTPQFFAWRARDPRAVERVLGGTGSRIAPERLALYQRLFRSPTHVSAALAMMANWDLASLARDLPRLPCPTLLVAGGNDLAVLPDQAFRLARTIPGARVELVRGLGHLMHEEDPRRLADIILRAVDELTAQPAQS